MLHTSPEHRFIRDHFMDIAQGGESSTWRDADLKEDLRADTASMTAVDVARAKDAARSGAAKSKAAWAAGHQAEARRIADATAAKVAEILGDSILPANHQKVQEEKDLGPRELAAKVRRF
jgi:hypothetical protein